MARQIDSHRMQLRLPREIYEEIEKYSTDQDLTLNGAIVDLVEIGLKTINLSNKGFQIDSEYFAFAEKNPTDRERREKMMEINKFFSRNPDYLLINIETSATGVECWYHRPMTLIDEIINPLNVRNRL